MSETRKIPAFTSESEEAEWWFQNRDRHAEEFVQAMEQGRVQRGGLSRRLAAADLTLNLNSDDLLKAKTLAERRGMEVSSYLSLLVHLALEREDAA
jgi:hypothetical protein